MSVILSINGELALFQKWNFPGGEVGVKLDNSLPKVVKTARVIVYNIPTSEDIFVAMNLLDALHHLGVNRALVSLDLEYFPYARQDRVCNQGESFALEVFIRMILSMQHTYTSIYMYDVHSEVTLSLLSKLKTDHVRIVNYPQCYFTELLPKFDNIIAPDAGAYNKASGTQPNSFHISLNKTRINGKVVYNDYPYDQIRGSACIVDDICDGGATFIAAAEMHQISVHVSGPYGASRWVIFESQNDGYNELQAGEWRASATSC